MTADDADAVFGAAATTMIGPLPHLDDEQAVAFAFERFDIPVCPSLPRRTPAESTVAQALTGIHGVAFGQYGALAVDTSRLDPAATVTTDLAGESFGGFAAALTHLREVDYSGPIKWQIVGPISVGVALMRAGAAPELAFDVAYAAVRSHVDAIANAVAAAAPGVQQLIVIDEVFARDLNDASFPISPVDAIDHLSGAMAAVEAHGLVGVRGGEWADLAMLIESGPHVLFVTGGAVEPAAGRLARFVEGGGRVVWGAASTRGPVIETAARARARLASAWRLVVGQRCDLDTLVARSMVSADGGLHGHDIAVAEQIVETLGKVSTAFRTAEGAWAELNRGT